MNYRELAWTTRAEILAHDFREREKDLLGAILLNSFDLDRPEAPMTAGFGQWTGRREDEERRICAALARSGVLTWDGQTARILPDASTWKIRRNHPNPLPGPLQQEFIEDRPLDAALASVSREATSVSQRFAQLRRVVDSGDNPPARGCASAKSQLSLAQPEAQALGCTQAKPKAKASALSCEQIAGELRRFIGDGPWRKWPQWQALVASQPTYVLGLISYATSVEKESGREIKSRGGYLSRIARDDGQWQASKLT